MRDFFETIKSY